MKNTLIANAEDMISHYQEAMMDFLNDTQGDQSTVDFAQDLIRLGKTLLDLSANYSGTALPAFRQELGAGHTLMMFGSKEFDQLEAWSKAGEDFQIAIFRESGLPVGVIQKEHIQW